MNPRILLLLLLLCAVGILLFPFLAPSSAPTEEEETRAPYAWSNRLVLPSPPAAAFQPDSLEDPIQRTVDRLLWGGTEIVQFTQAHLPPDRESLRRRIQERLDQAGGGASLSFRTLIQTLGVIGTRECIPTLLRFATQDPDYLQIAAIEALAQCPLESRVQDVLAELSGHPNEQVRGAAMRSAVNREEQWDTAQVVAFLEAYDGAAVRMMIHEVGKRRIHGAADALVRHLEAPQANDRQLAAGALMKLGDARGFEVAEDELASMDSRRVQAALTLYRDARALPPLGPARDILESGDPDERLALARALRRTEDEDPETGEAVVGLLERLADSTDPTLRMAAVEALHQRGHHRHLAPYRESLAGARGEPLKEAVKFLCEQLRDPESVEILRRRLAEELDATDRVNLLFGLRFVGGAEDAAWFVEWMQRAGTLEDRVAGSQTRVSVFATLYVQTLGARAGPALRQGLAAARTIPARLCFLDAIRGVASQAPDLLTDVVARMLDPAEEEEVRLGAAGCLPYFWSPDLGPSVLEWSQQVADRELAQRLLTLYVSYF